MTVRFAAYAGVALVLAAAAGAWVARHHAGAQARNGVSADTRAIAERLAGDDLASLALRGPVRGSDLADLDDLFRQQTLNDDTVRVTLYDRNGRVTYSTAHELIGTRGDTARIRAALEGDGRMTREGDVVRDFAPVHWLLADASFPNGVIAVDYDWGPVAREIRDRTLWQIMLVTFALLLLYGASVPILRRLTSSLAASEAQYRLIVDTAAEGVWLVDANGRTEFASEKLSHLLGYDVDDLCGRPLADFVDVGADDDWLRRRCERELVLMRSDGLPVYATVSSSPMADGGALVMLTDATHRKHMAHDFSNVITTVSGYTDLLLSELDEDDPRRAGIERIREAADAAADLTRQLVR